MKIQYYKEINEFFEATGFERRTNISSFFVFRFEDLSENSALKMPPYQKDFYQVSLILNAENADAKIDMQSNKSLQNTLYFLSPDHIFSWRRNFKTTGLIIYFKKEFLNFFSGDFKSEFSFFDLSNKNFIKLKKEEVNNITSEFEKLYYEYDSESIYRKQILQSSLLSLLYKFKTLVEETDISIKVFTRKEELVFKFRNLVSNSFIKYRKVSEYAEMLNTSPNSLNQIVKSETRKTAKEIISETIILNAKKQLEYNTDDISEISFSMGFDEPTHFIRFFKKETKMTPKQYRDSVM